MKYLVSLNVKNKKCLVVGAGQVACRKIAYLLECEASVSVVAESVSSDLELYNDKIFIIKKSFEEADLDGAYLVIAATNDEKVNDDIARLCVLKNILVNHVSNTESSSFSNVAHFIFKKFIFAVCSVSGSDPKSCMSFSQRLQKYLEKNADE